jgi:uncharacterized glyoxalase superfamily protein PhnB
MKTIPFFRVSNMKQAVDFYTRVLDFTLKYPAAQLDEIFVDLVNGDAELALTSLTGDQKAAINVYVEVEDVDKLFRKYIKRGLVVPQHDQSPVHISPVDQTWGRREFYVTDADGNTLRFFHQIHGGF